MRLITFNDGREKIGVMVGQSSYVDLTDDERLKNTTMIKALEMGETFLAIAKEVVETSSHKSISDIRLMSPIPRPTKIIAVGLNYHEHIQEAIDVGIAIPDVPLIFPKATTSVTGPYDEIHMPKVSSDLDYEAEFGIVIGKRCRHVKAEDAADVIAGFVVLNDVSVRDWQMATQTFAIGKSFDTHCPMGPALLTIDEVGVNPNLKIRLWVNDELRQEDYTGNLKFPCAKLVEHLSKAMTLEPGDIIPTGTPSGVACVMDPPKWLQVGDVVKVEVERIGVIENKVVAEPEEYVSRVFQKPR